MRKSRFPEEHIAMALRQAEAGKPVAEICRKPTSELGLQAAPCTPQARKLAGEPQVRLPPVFRRESRPQAQATKRGESAIPL